MAFPTKATHQQTRAHNSAVVLRALYDFGPISRADIARLSGLTRTTVGELVAQLLGDGLAREVGRGPSTGGKAPILVELVDDARHVIAVDLGEQAFKAAIVDLRGQVRTVIERPVEGLTGDAGLALVYTMLDELVDQTRDSLLGIGVGTPGIVDAETGTIRWAVNLDWQDLPLGDLIRERYGVPAELANDSRAAALAIQLFSEGRTTNLVAIKVGRGSAPAWSSVASCSTVTASVPARSAIPSSRRTALDAAAVGSAAWRRSPAPGRSCSVLMK